MGAHAASPDPWRQRTACFATRLLPPSPSSSGSREAGAAGGADASPAAVKADAGHGGRPEANPCSACSTTSPCTPRRSLCRGLASASSPPRDGQRCPAAPLPPGRRTPPSSSPSWWPPAAAGRPGGSRRCWLRRSPVRRSTSRSGPASVIRPSARGYQHHHQHEHLHQHHFFPRRQEEQLRVDVGGQGGELIVNFESDATRVTISTTGLESSINALRSTATVLTSTNVMDENSFSNPNKVVPVKRQLCEAGVQMQVTLAPHSLTSFDLDILICL